MFSYLAGWFGLTARLAHDPVSRAIIAKKGAGLAVSAVFAPAFAAYALIFATGSPLMGVAAALVVLVLVMTVDRFYVFGQETQTRVSVVGAIRLPLVMALAVQTAIALFVAINHTALDATANDVRTERAITQQKTMGDATGLQRALGVERDAGKALATLRAQRWQLPPDIAAQKQQVIDCAERVDRHYAALARADALGPRGARVAVAAERAQCAGLARTARKAENAYAAALDDGIARAVAAADRATSAATAASNGKADLVRRATAVDATAIEARSLAVIARYVDDHPLAIIELLALYLLVIVLDGAGLWVASILARSPAGCAFEAEVTQARATQLTDAAFAIQRIAQAAAHIRQVRLAAKANDAVPFIRSAIAQTSRVVAQAEAEQLQRIAPVLAVAGSIEVMTEASLAAEEAARRAHERDPAIGRLADAMLERALDQAVRGMAA